MYQGVYPLATALARPLIAQLLVEVAERERADAVAHGCTGKGNDQVRFDVAVRALDPKLEVMAPMRVGMGLSREQEIDYASERGIEIPITRSRPTRSTRTCGAAPSRPASWRTRGRRRPPTSTSGPSTRAPRRPSRPRSSSASSGGIPVSIDGEAVAPVELVERLNALGGRHGVGRIDHVEDRLVGIKSREIYEAPAAVILHTAHAALEGLTLSKEQLRFNRLVSDELAQATYDGIWFSALHRDLREYVASAQRVVNGEVRLRLDHGNAHRRGPPQRRLAVRPGARHVRRGGRVRPRRRGGLHPHLRAAAQDRGGAPRLRVELDRAAAARSCRSPSPTTASGSRPADQRTR